MEYGIKFLFKIFHKNYSLSSKLLVSGFVQRKVRFQHFKMASNECKFIY